MKAQAEARFAKVLGAVLPWPGAVLPWPGAVLPWPSAATGSARAAH